MVNITITDKAVEQIKEAMKKQDKKVLRILAFPGGCAGVQYDLIFDEKKEDDTVVENGEVTIVVQKEIMPLVEGATIDFVETEHGKGFVIKPKQSSGCSSCPGCH